MKKIIICFVLALLILLGILFFETNIYYIGFILPAFMFLNEYAAYSVRYEIGSYFGYRAGVSEKNADTWEFANTYSGKLMMKVSIAVLIIMELLMLLIKPDPLKAEFMLFPAVIPYLIIWVKTEKELNKIFDWQGNRRELLNTKEA